MIFPVPVFLKRFAAALQVLILGIIISSLIRGTVFYFLLSRTRAKTRCL